MKHHLTAIALGLALAGAEADALSAQPALPPIAPVIERLEAEGYAMIETHRSWLGRLIVLATRDGITREIVLNRTTGAILSDRQFPAGPDTDVPAAAPGSGPAPAGAQPQGSTRDGRP